MECNDIKQIKDLGLVAGLVSAGFEIFDIERDSQGRSYFKFQETSELDQAINQYWSNALTVSARQFFENTKMLKTRIYSDIN